MSCRNQGKSASPSSKLIKNYFDNYWDSTLGPSILWAGNSCIVDIEINVWSQYFVNLQINLSHGILSPTNESTDQLQIFEKRHETFWSWNSDVPTAVIEIKLSVSWVSNTSVPSLGSLHNTCMRITMKWATRSQSHTSINFMKEQGNRNLTKKFASVC